MIDPAVGALIYSIKHRDSINYTNASASHFGDKPKCDLPVEDKRS